MNLEVRLLSEWLFEEPELRARRQFHKLFAESYFITTLPAEAIHNTPWNAHVLDDILHRVWENNPLTPNDIEVILQAGGFYNDKHEVWFGWNKSTPMIESVLQAAAPYMDTRSYATMKVQVAGKVANSFEIFFQRIIVNPLPKARVPQADVYKLFLEYCDMHRLPVLGKRAFKQLMLRKGIHAGKGYVDRKQGVNFYVLACNMSKEVWDAKPPSPSKKEGQEESYTPEQLRDERRRRAQVPDESSQEQEEGVSEAQEGQDTSAGDVGGIIEDDSSDAKFIATADDTDDEDIWGENDDSLPDADTADAFTADASTDAFATSDEGIFGDSTDDPTEEPLTKETVVARIRALPKGVRRVFQTMKATYLINPEHFTYDDFTAMCAGVVPFADESEQQNMWHLFLAYAED